MNLNKYCEARIVAFTGDVLDEKGLQEFIDRCKELEKAQIERTATFEEARQHIEKSEKIIEEAQEIFEKLKQSQKASKDDPEFLETSKRLQKLVDTRESFRTEIYANLEENETWSDAQYGIELEDLEHIDYNNICTLFSKSDVPYYKFDVKKLLSDFKNNKFSFNDLIEEAQKFPNSQFKTCKSYLAYLLDSGQFFESAYKSKLISDQNLVELFNVALTQKPLVQSLLQEHTELSEIAFKAFLTTENLQSLSSDAIEVFESALSLHTTYEFDFEKNELISVEESIDEDEFDEQLDELIQEIKKHHKFRKFNVSAEERKELIDLYSTNDHVREVVDVLLMQNAEGIFKNFKDLKKCFDVESTLSKLKV